MYATPDYQSLQQLCEQLTERADALDTTGDWPAEGLRLCGEAGVFRWFIDPAYGGWGWDNEQVVRGYLALSAACLSTTFVITQRTGACRRIAEGNNDGLKSELLPKLANGELFATVGISHLTTSRRHLAEPVLRATHTEGRWQLDGFSPWVTGADHADIVVTGATVMRDGSATEEQILIAVPTTTPGVSAPAPEQLVGLSASHTGRLDFNNTIIDERWLVQGPIENVMTAGRSATTGGHETSTLALGLTGAALGYLSEQADLRDDLREASEALVGEHEEISEDLLAITRGEPACTTAMLRQRANSLVLRATQAALAAAKGSGYVTGHPTGRWCREALFFLVWSCPQPVMNANLCELAGIAE